MAPTVLPGNRHLRQNIQAICVLLHTYHHIHCTTKHGLYLCAVHTMRKVQARCKLEVRLDTLRDETSLWIIICLWKSERHKQHFTRGRIPLLMLLVLFHKILIHSLILLLLKENAASNSRPKNYELAWSHYGTVLKISLLLVKSTLVA